MFFEFLSLQKMKSMLFEVFWGDLGQCSERRLFLEIEASLQQKDYQAISEKRGFQTMHYDDHICTHNNDLCTYKELCTYNNDRICTYDELSCVTYNERGVTLFDDDTHF